MGSENNFAILDTEELLALTRWYITKQDFGQALLFNKHCILKKNTPDETYKLSGKIYAELGLYEHAKVSFKKYLDKNPDSITELFQYGMVHMDTGETQQALKIWENLLLKDSTYPPALFYSALNLANSNRSDEALKKLNILIKSTPTDNFYFNKARNLLTSIETNKVLKQNEDDKNSNFYTKDGDRTLN